jgi:2-succinyl-5-enolpyruvyl-6-hydroxy-3-cyclohexene-1-carboxylate synthase
MAETLNQRWAAHLLGALVQGGVRHVVIAPGSRSTPLALAAAERSDPRTWPVIDERVAGFFALGLAKGAQAPVAVICTSGTAGAHLLPAVIEAREGATPLIVVTADRPWELHDFGAAQTIDQTELFAGYVHGRVELCAPEDDPAVLRHLSASLVRVLAFARRGPVHVNAPFREPLAADHPGSSVDQSAPRFVLPELAPNVLPAVPLVAHSQRGLIVCGPREGDDGFAAAVHQLGAHLGFPVLAEATSNARYGYPDSVAMYDAVWRSAQAAATLQPDLVLRFGGGLTAKSMLGLLAPTIVFSDDERVFDPHHVALQVIRGDATLACEALRQAVPAGRDGTWRKRWLGLEQGLRERLAAQVAFDEPAVAREVVASLHPGSNLVLSSSMPVRDVDAFAPTAAGALRVYSNRGVNGIDGVTSTALGVAAASGRATTLLIGDVALLHDIGAWVAARQLGVPLTVVVINNDGGGIFHFLPVAERTAHFERLFGTPHGVDLAHLAALAGARLQRPLTTLALREALADATASGGLNLIEVRTDRQANVEAHRVLFAALSEVVR